MSIPTSKLAIIGVTSILMIAPWVLWGLLSIVVRRSSVDLQRLGQWLRALQWVAWTCGVFLYSGYFLGGHFPWVYAAAVATLSVGLSFPARWLKDQLALPVSSPL